MNDELQFDDYGDYSDDGVPIFDRGKQRDLAVDDTIPVPLAGNSPRRTCPTCHKRFSLATIEIGTINSWGDAVFFCSTGCKQEWIRTDPEAQSPTSTGMRYKDTYSENRDGTIEGFDTGRRTEILDDIGTGTIPDPEYPGG